MKQEKRMTDVSDMVIFASRYGLTAHEQFNLGGKWVHADFPSLGRVRISQANMKNVKYLP
jgi:hypothetical protein